MTHNEGKKKVNEQKLTQMLKAVICSKSKDGTCRNMKNTQTELLKVTTPEMKNTLCKIKNRLDIAEVVSEFEDGNNLT